MDIFVCEQCHDNDCGIFSTMQAARMHLDACDLCEGIQEYQLVATQFVKVGDFARR